MESRNLSGIVFGPQVATFFFFFVLIKEESSASEETAGESRQSGRKPDTAPVIQQYSLPDAVVANDSVR